MKKTVIEIWHFDLEQIGRGLYKVTYTSPRTGKKWSANTNNMELIDAVRNSDNPKKKDLEELKRIAKDSYSNQGYFYGSVYQNGKKKMI